MFLNHSVHLFNIKEFKLNFDTLGTFLIVNDIRFFLNNVLPICMSGPHTSKLEMLSSITSLVISSMPCI